MNRSRLEAEVDWNGLYDLKEAEEDKEARKEYEAVVKSLIFFGRLTYGRHWRFGVSLKGELMNPIFENHTLYFTQEADAEEVQRRFVNSTVVHYEF